MAALEVQNALLTSKSIVSFLVNSAVMELKGANAVTRSTGIGRQSLRVTAPSPATPWVDPETGIPTREFTTFINRIASVFKARNNPNRDSISQIITGNEQIEDLNIGGSKLAALASHIDTATGSLLTASMASSEQFKNAPFTGFPGSLLSTSSAGTTDPDATIEIVQHTRITTDGIQYIFTGGNIGNLFRSSLYYVYFDIAQALPGGILNSVSYSATLDVSVAFNGPNRVVLGTVATPASAGSSSAPVDFTGDGVNSILALP